MPEMEHWLKPIHDALDDWDEDDTYIKIESVVNREDGLDIGLLVWRSVGDQRRWIIECREVIDSRIHFEVSDWVRHVTEGPVLVPYLEEQAELYFQGTLHDYRSVVGELLLAHRAIMDPRFPITNFVHWLATRSNGFSPHTLTRSFFDFGSGLIAKGPASLIRAFQAALERHGLRTSVLPSAARIMQQEASRSTGSTKHFSALEFNESFVIAQSFRVR